MRSPQGVFRVFRKSENTNGFGHHQLFVINDSNEVFITHRSCSHNPKIGDTIRASNGLLNGCEVTSYVDTPKGDVLTEIRRILN